MKTKILFITSLLLIVGCSKEPINYKTTLVERDDVYYTKDTNKPYSGQVFSLNDDGKKKSEGTLKNGKRDGLSTEWYDNGQKSYEGNFKDGEYDGLIILWYENGQKRLEEIYKDGKQDGLSTAWYQNGQKRYEIIFKDGKISEIKGEWNEDGLVKN